jgi:hypothetical protein
MGLWPHGKEHIKQHFVNKNEKKNTTLSKQFQNQISKS